MPNPTVSFVVPCYKLGHLLPECIESILSQTYLDLEILIMDDKSPDKTAEIAKSYCDPRVRYIRNEQNLGPLRNYNMGISLSRGEYVWLISADDYFRRPYIVEKYVNLMDAHPQIGYTFCPGFGVRQGKEGAVWKGSEYGKRDRIIKGHAFLKTLMEGNQILAPSALVRRRCYETISMFPIDVSWAGQPIDLVWGGDWYLWCVFALFFDVGYFAEPMVCYREHELSMTNTITQKNKSVDCAAAEIGTTYMVRQMAVDAGLNHASRECVRGIARQYTKHCVSRQYDWLNSSATSCIGIDKAEEWLSRSTGSEREKRWIRAQILSGLGDEAWARKDAASAREFYRRGLQQDRTMAKTLAKLALASMGNSGTYLRRVFQHRRLAA